ncbi:hypothetical protein GCM10011609_88050 [Lentzea pudingi]|uniref:Uncharacterized protein n=1 Tax=Lentzea pudingi TaxID=1789439 RepID=A0ABQ2ITQ5_9PSEU|nr:hypothetical protein GCM10011609_88050 [Lentzea pudingi]
MPGEDADAVNDSDGSSFLAALAAAVDESAVGVCQSGVVGAESAALVFAGGFAADKTHSLASVVRL